MLVIRNLVAGYGPSTVLFDVSLEVGAGQVVTLLGRNGMGKTTTIHALMGLLASRSGTITWHGRPIRGLPPERIARAGIGLVPEGRQVFATLTVEENLVATAANRLGRSPPWTLARIFDLFPALAACRMRHAATLSGGEQQMLAIGRALMTNPALLILDEATEGLAPVIRAQIWQCLARLKLDGLAILIVDKNLAALRRLADRHFVIEKGRTVWSGTGTDLGRDRVLIEQRLGV